MGRSVSTHRHAVETIYLHDVFDYFFLEDLRNILTERYPSFEECDRWQDREDHVILENKRAEVSVSAYCDLVAVCLAPLDPYNPLDHAWCDRVAKGFRSTLHKAYPSSALNRLGSASNGEAFFSPVNRSEGLVTSKEGELW